MIDLEEILSKMNPNQKINYDRVMQQMAKRWAQEEVRPKILVHVCCAPCSTYTLEYLTQYADLTVYFANSNIHPKDEYLRRAYVVQKFISDFNEKTGNNVDFIEAPYDPSEYFQKVHGLEDEPEGGERCTVCFDYRLDKAAKMAVELGYDYFASALTISPHKNSQVINSVGIECTALLLYDRQLIPIKHSAHRCFLYIEQINETDIVFRNYSLSGVSEITIGRMDDNDIACANGLVSSYHAVIKRIGASRWIITDSGSANGVFVKG